jgi:hypothetical protein
MSEMLKDKMSEWLQILTTEKIIEKLGKKDGQLTFHDKMFRILKSYRSEKLKILRANTQNLFMILRTKKLEMKFSFQVKQYLLQLQMQK